MGLAKVDMRDTFREDVQKMGVSDSGTRDKARSVASDRDHHPVSQQGQQDLSLSK